MKILLDEELELGADELEEDELEDMAAVGSQWGGTPEGTGALMNS